MIDTVTIRKLNYGDAIAFGKVIKSFTKAIGDTSLLEMIKSGGTEEGKESNPEVWVEVGISILRAAIEVVGEDAESFLLGLVVEEFENKYELPFDVLIQILDQLIDAPELPNFFSSALHLFKKMQQLQGKFKSS